jgi:hypothetical protein
MELIHVTVTGITYLDGRPFIGTGLTGSGKQVKLVYGESSQNLRILDKVTVSGFDHYSPHHHDRAFAVERVEAVERSEFNTLRRHLRLPSGTAAHAPVIPITDAALHNPLNFRR